MMAEQLTDILGEGIGLLGEFTLLAGGLAILLVDMLYHPKQKNFSPLIIFTLLVVAASIFYVHLSLFKVPVYIWDVLRLDVGSLYLQVLLVTGTLVYAISIYKVRTSGAEAFLVLLILFGAFLVVKTVNLLVLLLGLEIMSLSAYALTAKEGGGQAKEAALKYVIFGAISTAIFLYGASILYGITGSLSINDPSFIEKLFVQEPMALLVIFGLTSAGIFFKITAFPFHVWAPNVYQSIKAPLAAYFSIVPKAAALAFLIKFVTAFEKIGILLPWEIFILVIAIITMTLGNLAALSQENPQRMLAYSSIAHTGFLLLPIAVFGQSAFQSVIFYLSIYLCMNFLAFSLIYYFRHIYGFKKIRDFSGSAKGSPILMIIMVIAMISLTGLPPTAGFTAKLFIFTSLWQGYEQTTQALYLIALFFGLANTVISLFYYLKIPYFMIFREGISEDEKHTSEGALLLNYLCIILVLPLIILFIWPEILTDWINMINFVL